MYVGVSILNCVRQPPNLKGYVSGSLVFGLPVVAFTLARDAGVAHRVRARLERARARRFLSAARLDPVRTRRESFRLLVEAFAALGVIFASLAIPLAFDTRTTAAMWAVEGAGLLWLGVRQERKLARAFGALLQIGAGIGYLLGYARACATTQPILNSCVSRRGDAGVSGVFSGYWLFRNRSAARVVRDRARRRVHVLGNRLVVRSAAATRSTGTSRSSRSARLLVYARIDGRAAGLAGHRSRQWPLPRSIALFLPAVVGAVRIRSRAASSAIHSRSGAQWAGSLIFVTHFAMLRIGGARSVTLRSNGCTPAPAGCSRCCSPGKRAGRSRERTTGVWASLAWGLVPALLLAWLGRRELRPAWPVAQHADRLPICTAPRRSRSRCASGSS